MANIFSHRPVERCCWTSRVHEFNLPTQQVFSVFWTKVALALERVKFKFNSKMSEKV